MKSHWKAAIEMKGMVPAFKKNVHHIVQAAADVARYEWVKIVRERLHSTKSIYISSIGQPVVKGNTATITLSGWLPNALECGCPPFDQKVGFLRSRGAKRDAKGNPYFTVPFMLKSAGAMGASPPVMPKPVYRMASAMSFGQVLQLPKKYEGLAIKTRLSPDIKKWGDYTWKTSPFQNVLKTQKWSGLAPGVGSGKIGQYTTFRRVSKKSDPNSWIHPGFSPLNAMETASEKMRAAIPDIINSILSEAK